MVKRQAKTPVGIETTLSVAISIATAVLPMAKPVYLGASAVLFVLAGHLVWQISASKGAGIMVRMLLTTLTASALAIALNLGWHARFAEAEQAKGPPESCPSGMILQGKTPQTAAIRNLGGSVDRQTATGPDAIENICVKAGTQEASKSAPIPKQNSAPPSREMGATKKSSSDTTVEPCAHVEQSIDHVFIIDNSSREIAPFSAPKGACVDRQTVSDTYTYQAGVVRNEQATIGQQTVTNAHSLDEKKAATPTK